MPKRRVEALRPGERRYFAQMPALGGHPEQRSCLELEGGTRCIEVPRLIDGEGQRQHLVLHLACDQGSIGLPALMYLQYSVGLRMTVSNDLFHRVHNDIVDSVAEAGLMLVRLEYLVAAKVRQGPFAGQANCSIMASAAAEMSVCWTAENPVFQLLYRDIVAEHPEALGSADIGTKEHMATAWEWCCAELQRVSCGSNVKTGRWFSFEEQGRESSGRRWLDVLLLSFLGLQRGWWKHFGDNPVASAMDGLDDNEQPLPGEAGEDAADAQEEAPMEDGPVDRRLSVAAGRAEVRKRRQKCCSILHFTCNLLCKDAGARLWRGMCHATVPLEAFFGEAIAQVKNSKGLQHLHSELSGGVMKDICLQLMQNLFSFDFGAKVDLPRCMAAQTPFLRQQNALVIGRLWAMVQHLSGQLLLTGMAYQMPPLSFLRLLDPVDANRQEALATCRRDWEALQALEATSLESGACQSFTTALLVGKQQFSRELYVRLAEVGFDMVPADVRSDLLGFSRSYLSSLICEQFFNEMREAAGDNRAKRMEAFNMYHTMARASKSLHEFDRPPLVVTSAARAAAPPKLPPSTFCAEPNKFSLGPEVLDGLMSPTPSWPTMSPQRLKLVPMAWELMRAHNGNWAEMQNSFLSLLIQPGSLVCKPGEKVGRLVLCATHFGALTYRMALRPESVIELAPLARESVEFVSVDNPSRWKIVATRVEAIAPGGGAAGKAAIVLKHDGSAEPLLRHACRRGFRGLTIEHLRRLCRVVEVSEPRPATEARLLNTLAVAIMKDEATEDFLKQAMVARHECADASAHIQPTKIFATDGGVGDALDVEFSDDEVVEEQIKRLREQKAKAARQQAERVQAVEGLRSSATSSSAAPKATGERAARKFVAVQGDGITAAAAKAYLPPDCALSKDDKRENRWRLRMKWSNAERSKSYGRRSECTDWEAMTFLIQLAWREHSRLTGHPCPFSFSSDGGGESAAATTT